MIIGLPLKLLYESMGHIVTVELKNGELVRGNLVRHPPHTNTHTHMYTIHRRNKCIAYLLKMQASVEDNMNLLMVTTTVTARDGKTSHLAQMFVPGSQVRFVIVPDMLKHAPMFKLAKNKQKGLGIGQQRRAMVMRAKAGGNVFLSSSARGRGGGATRPAPPRLPPQ